MYQRNRTNGRSQIHYPQDHLSDYQAEARWPMWHDDLKAVSVPQTSSERLPRITVGMKREVNPERDIRKWGGMPYKLFLNLPTPKVRVLPERRFGTGGP